MSEKLKKILQSNSIQNVRRRSPLIINSGTTIKDVVASMKTKKRGCVLIQKDGKMTGIFTERDILTRVIEPKKNLKTPIDDVMTSNPATLKPESTVFEAVFLMSQKGYRHVPLTDEQDRITGFVSVRDILDFLAEHFPYQVYNLPPDPHQINRAAEGA